MIIACVALAVALGGVSYAATVLPKNSVGTAQLQKGAVTGGKLKKNAVTGTKVKDGSLAAGDFKAGQLPAGPKGDPGAPGTPGAPGEPGAPGATNVVTRTSTVSAPVGVNDFSVACAPGEKAVGGGGTGPAFDPEVTLAGTFASPANAGSMPTGWTARYNVTGIAHNVTTYVVCAKP